MIKGFIDLDELLSFKDFSYRNYTQGERDILNPQLQEMGYTDIQWYMGDSDSFGPLTRVCYMKNPDGEIVRGIYG